MLEVAGGVVRATMKMVAAADGPRHRTTAVAATRQHAACAAIGAVTLLVRTYHSFIRSGHRLRDHEVDLGCVFLANVDANFGRASSMCSVAFRTRRTTMEVILAADGVRHGTTSPSTAGKSTAGGAIGARAEGITFDIVHRSSAIQTSRLLLGVPGRGFVRFSYASPMGGVASSVLRATMEMVFTADGIGNGTTTPHPRWKLTTCASGGTSVTTIGTNYVVQADCGAHGFCNLMREG